MAMQILKAKNIRTFELKLGKRALIFFVLGMSCFLFVIFLFGVQVGKMIDAHPEKLSRGIPSIIMESFGWTPKQLKLDAAANETAKELAPPADEEKVDLTFYDTLAKKNMDVKALAPEAPEPVAPQTEVRSHAAGTEKPPAIPHVKEKYQIQVASLKEKDKADDLCKSLIRAGYSPRIVSMDLQKRGKWFRVILDGFESKEQAQKSVNAVSRKISGVNCVISKKK